MAELNWDLDQGTVVLGRPVSPPKGQEPPAQDLGPDYFPLRGFQRIFGQLVESQGGVQLSKGLLFAPALPLAPCPRLMWGSWVSRSPGHESLSPGPSTADQAEP